MLLDRLLGALEVEVAPFAVCDVRRGWSVDMPPDGHVALHFIVSGEGTLSTSGAANHPFGEGSVILVPPGHAHRIELPHATDHVLDAAADCSVPEHGLKRVVAGEGSPGVLMVCGAVRATYAGTFGLFDEMNAPLVIDAGDEPMLRHVFEGLLAEQARLRPGSAAMMRALMTQGLVLLLRRMCDGGDCRVPWLAVVGDAQLSAALTAILDNPAEPHTVESLAKLAAMSRSSFSDRFSRAFGRPAIDLLREVRLRRGAQLLRSTDLPVQTVAEKVGFASRSHFSRSFAAMYGTDPSGYRNLPPL
jgi:AraC-like DNA-binding protein/mannose-6-phosphate isomerase-like protein (cupin superfamily)